MINKLPYLYLLIIFVFIPSISLWVIYWNSLKTYFRLFIFITIGAFIWGFLFDLVGSNFWHIWSYSNNLNVYFLRLPLEEYLTLLFLSQELTVIMLIIRKKIYG